MKRNRLGLFSYTLVFIFVTVIAVGALLYWNLQQRISDFNENQHRLMEGSVISASNELSFLVEDLRRRVSIFAEEHVEEIVQIAKDRDFDTLDELRKSVRRRFPNSFTYTVTSDKGELFVEDFEGHVGQVCKNDIIKFAGDEHKKEVYVHPNPLGYHFDIMAKWRDPNNKSLTGVFFVSFLLDDISRLLKNGELPGHKLILTKQDDPDLIEVTAQGGRNELSRDTHLNPDELSRVGYKKDVPGSFWTLSDLPPMGAVAERRRELMVEAAAALGVLIAVSMVILIILGRIQRQLNRSQAQLVQSEKMASLGQMVAGIAHEMNTPLAYIRSNLEITRDKLPMFQQLIDMIDKVKEKPNEISPQVQLQQFVAELKSSELIKELNGVAGDSIAGLDDLKGLVMDLKDFSRLDRKAEDHVQVEKSLEHAINILRHETKSIQLKRDFEVTDTIRGIPSQLNQVFLNIINNAVQAVDPSNGLITIRTRQSKDTVSVEIEDNGIGIPIDVQDKIFDPFYTSKEVGKGTGLGLTIAYKIVQEHGGNIQVISNEGQGARFRIELPVG